MKNKITKDEFEKLYNEWFPKIKSLGTDSLRFHIMRNLYGDNMKTTFQEKNNLSDSLDSFESYEKLCKETRKDVFKKEIELKIINDNKFEVYMNKTLKCEILDYYQGKTKYFILYSIVANKKSDTYEREISELIVNDALKTTRIKFNPTWEEIEEKFLPTLK